MDCEFLKIVKKKVKTVGGSIAAWNVCCSREYVALQVEF